MKSELPRVLEIVPGSAVCVVGEDGLPPWYGDYRVWGVLTTYLVVEHYLTPWARSDKSKAWDVATLVSLTIPREVSARLVPPGTSFIRTADGHCLLHQFLLIQRYPDLSWADDRVVFAFGVLDASIAESAEVPHLEWKRKTMPLTSHSLFRVGDCK